MEEFVWIIYFEILSVLLIPIEAVYLFPELK